MFTSEFFLKAIIIIFILILAGCLIKITLGSHIDVPKSLQNIKQLLTNKIPKYDTIIATRDDKCIYQNGECVGEITGEIKYEEDKILFSEISDAGNIKLKEIIEYKRYKIKLIEYKSFTGQLNKTIVSEEGVKSITRNNVYRSLVFKIIE